MDQTAAFNALVRAYHSDLYRYAYWLSHDAAIAEDCVQETFVRAWRNWQQLRDQSKVKAWLLTILRREHARIYQRQPQAEHLDVDEMTFPAPEPHDDTQVQQLRSLIAQLPLEYREPLLMQLVVGLSGEQIGDVLGLEKNAVMVRLHRAREKLKQMANVQFPASQRESS